MPKGTVVAFDAAVRRIERAYDTLSRPTTITQYDASSGGNVVDEVKYTYESWGFISKFEQDHNSTVATGGTLLYDVEHSFEKVTSGRNTIRRTGMTTPSGRSVTFDYTNAGTGTWFNEISRVRHVKLESVTVATYRYNGVGHLVGTTYNEADVFSRRYGGSSLTQLDRFNRPTDWTWTKDLSTDRNFVDRDIAWDENSNVIRVEDNIHTGRDMAFSNDALNRLIMIEQGTWSGSAITSRTFQELWTLTPTGNWDLYKLDLNGNNTFTDSGDLNDDRTHNKANELTARDTDDNGTDNYTLVHDAAGNLREDGANYKFTYDAFGRLRKVLDANAGDALVAEYWYNGLGYRIAAHQDTDSDGDVDGNDTIVRFIYDERWRVVATYHDSDTVPTSEFIHHNAGLDGQGGSSYIDSVILRDRDASGDPSVMEERVYFCQDWRHDVVAIVSDTGKMLEWVDYTPYGMPYGRPAGDTDSDYDWDATDAGNITGGYDVRKDANLDGVIDANDVTHANSITGGYQTLGRTVLSSTGIRNFTGYAGYVGDANLTGTWHVRRRVFDSELGRWLTRDPWGYVDGMNLFQFARSNPTARTDPRGNCSACASDAQPPRRTPDSYFQLPEFTPPSNSPPSTPRINIPITPCEIRCSYYSNPAHRDACLAGCAGFGPDPSARCIHDCSLWALSDQEAYTACMLACHARRGQCNSIRDQCLRSCNTSSAAWAEVAKAFVATPEYRAVLQSAGNKVLTDVVCPKLLRGAAGWYVFAVTFLYDGQQTNWWKCASNISASMAACCDRQCECEYRRCLDFGMTGYVRPVDGTPSPILPNPDVRWPGGVPKCGRCVAPNPSNFPFKWPSEPGCEVEWIPA